MFPHFLLTLVECLGGRCGIYVIEIWGKEVDGYDRDLNAKTLEMPRTEASHSAQRQLVQILQMAQH